MPTRLAQGAEAILYHEGEIVRKVRTPKSYRHPILDKKLRLSRTRREAKILEKLAKVGIRGPTLFSTDEKTCTLEMSFVKGALLRDCLERDPTHYAEQLGELIATLHDNDIIHGDLTTSNMIVNDTGITLIDFGLSFFSQKVEDKAVDLHLLEEALESKHYTVFEQCFDTFKKSYSQYSKNAKAVFERLMKVEKRGRNKERY